MIKTIVALNADWDDMRVLVLDFEVPNREFDLKAAVKKATLEYCLTEEGKSVYSGNCHCFNWADFAAEIPESICRKHGFKLIPYQDADEIVDLHEQLVDESEVFPDDEEYDEED